MVSFTVTWPNTAAATSPATGTSAQPWAKASATRAGTSTSASGRNTRLRVRRSINRPTVAWVSAPHRVAAVAAMPASQTSEGSSASRSCISLGIRREKALNTRPETAAISSSTMTARRTRWRGMAGNGMPAARRWWSVEGMRSQARPSATQREPGHDKCPAPAELAGEQGGDHRGGRHADIAEHPVQPERFTGRSPATSTSMAVPTG